MVTKTEKHRLPKIIMSFTSTVFVMSMASSKDPAKSYKGEMSG